MDVRGTGHGSAEPPVRLAVIIGSTREGRAGGEIARWFASRAGARGGIAVDVVDLAAYDFPARYPAVATPEVCEFTARVDGADAFAVVTPEYNRSYPASLKQAIDFAYDEWQAKPVGFVAYGHRSEGRYAVEHLRCVFTELHTVTMRGAVTLNLLDGALDDVPGGSPARDAEVMLDQLTWWGLALREARARRPYVS